MSETIRLLRENYMYVIRRTLFLKRQIRPLMGGTCGFTENITTTAYRGKSPRNGIESRNVPSVER